VLIARLRAEFEEMPGLLLTSAQTARLCGLEASLCDRFLAALVEARVLARTADGRFRRPAGV
jgi:DNA-binding IclR family transcriptional regulator